MDDASPTTPTVDVLKKKELIDTITSNTSEKRAVVKKVVEATLAHLAEQVLAERDMALPPLGKVKPLDTTIVQGAHVVKCKIRVPVDGATPEDDEIAYGAFDTGAD